MSQQKYTEEDIKRVLFKYYIDDNSSYQSKFRDIVYLFFIDLVENEYDILNELDKLQ